MKLKSKNKICLITLGCSKNTVDSERLLTQLRVNSFELIDDAQNADTIIINTCGFIAEAKKESIDTILNAVALKKTGKVKKVLVAGCLSERYKSELEKEIPEVDAYFGTEKYEEILNNLGGELKYELLGERLLTTPTHTAYLKISEGCDHPCSFCAIPLMRGLHKSTPMELLLAEAQNLALKGVKELIIIGQDTTDYGKDIYKRRNVAELLTKLSEIDGIEWIRLMYVYPSNFPEDLIEVIANNKKICKYIDIPLQHISDKVLKSMRRGITKRKTLELLEKLKESIPNLVLRTTFIVGYPTEKQSDFLELCDFVSETKFDKLGVFTYSQEENTVSYVLGDPVSPSEKKRRLHELMEIQREISLKKNEELLGQKIKVLIENKENGYYVGRSFRDAPEIDGEVLVDAAKQVKLGNFYEVKTYDYNDYDLFAKFIS